MLTPSKSAYLPRSAHLKLLTSLQSAPLSPLLSSPRPWKRKFVRFQNCVLLNLLFHPKVTLPPWTGEQKNTKRRPIITAQCSPVTPKRVFYPLPRVLTPLKSAHPKCSPLPEVLTQKCSPLPEVLTQKCSPLRKVLSSECSPFKKCSPQSFHPSKSANPSENCSPESAHPSKSANLKVFTPQKSAHPKVLTSCVSGGER